jgi:hypothetical protein
MLNKKKMQADVYHDSWYMNESNPTTCVSIALDGLLIGLPVEDVRLLAESWREIEHQLLKVRIQDVEWMEEMGAFLTGDSNYSLPNVYRQDRMGEWDIDDGAVFLIIDEFRKNILNRIYEVEK